MVTGANAEDLTPLLGLQDLADGLKARIAQGERGEALFEAFRAATRASGEADVFIDTVHDILVVQRDGSFAPSDGIAAEVLQLMMDYPDRSPRQIALAMAERYPVSAGLNALAAHVAFERKDYPAARKLALASRECGCRPGGVAVRSHGRPRAFPSHGGASDG